MRTNVILDVDTGSDDAFALLLAARSPAVNLLGVTVAHGNRPLSDCVNNTLQVLELLGCEAPVYPGCPAPIVRELSKGRIANNPNNDIVCTEGGVEYSLHPAQFDLPAPRRRAENRHACSFILETALSSTEPLTIITTAPPTNIGMAFRMDARLSEHITEVIFMGGAVGRGNVTPVAEANFLHDPEAAKIILDSGVKTRLLTLNATHSAELTYGDAQRLLAAGGPVADFYGRLLETRITAAQKLGWGNGQSEAVHDGLAVAALIDPSVVTEYRRCVCDIDIAGGASDGQLICRSGGEKDEVALAANKPRYFELILQAAGA